jgi:hypothetical protein
MQSFFEKEAILWDCPRTFGFSINCLKDLKAKNFLKDLKGRNFLKDLKGLKGRNCLEEKVSQVLDLLEGSYCMSCLAYDC